jgi:hemolysin III
VIALDGWVQDALLVSIWLLAIAGITLEWLPFKPPRGYVTAVYITMGWIAVLALPAIWDAIGITGIALIFGGGLLYTVGAFVHAFHWPDPWPRVFGFHEIWHVFVLAAAALHFACIAFVVVPLA